MLIIALCSEKNNSGRYNFIKIVLHNNEQYYYLKNNVCLWPLHYFEMPKLLSIIITDRNISHSHIVLYTWNYITGDNNNLMPAAALFQ